MAAYFATNPDPTSEEPTTLQESQGRLASAILSQNGGRGVPQAQIKVVSQGVASAGVTFLDVQITNVGTDDAGNISLAQFLVQPLCGGGQAMLNNILSPRPPVATDHLSVNASSTVRIYVSTVGTVNTISLTVSGTAADIFGTQTAFSQTQTVTLGTTAEAVAEAPAAEHRRHSRSHRPAPRKSTASPLLR